MSTPRSGAVRRGPRTRPLHRHPVPPLALAAAAALAMGAGPALGANWTIRIGHVDPPYGAERAVGTTYASMLRAWGEPRDPATDVPVAVWRGGLEVTLRRAPDGRAVVFTVVSPAWRTRAGVRPGSTEALLRARYGDRLERVRDRRGLLGVEHHYMLRAHGRALGFVMRPGRVLWITTGAAGPVRAGLAFAGPV